MQTKLIRFLLLAWLGFWVPNSLAAQGGGCVCTNCPQNMPDFFMGTFTITVMGATNNSLASPTQGVCAVHLHFTHEYIGDLSITLTSPAGQSVNLIGPIGLFGETDFTEWDITFLPCSEPVVPDPGFSQVWQNNQAWGLFGNYTGSYYPHSGCLENFNTGPVNGTWSLNVTDGQANDIGNFINYEIIFCDGTGISCMSCAANAGNLNQPDIVACQNSPSLNLNLPPTYQAPNTPPPANTYSYTYAIGLNGILIAYDPDADLSGYAAGNYTVCGLSYFSAAESLLPAPNGVLTLAQLNTLFASPNSPLCADLTNNCVNVLINPLTPNEDQTETICWNDCFEFHSQSFCATGNYPLNLVDANNCPYVATLHLTERPNNVKNLTETICGGSCSANPSFPDACSTGNYVVILKDKLNCDSTVNLNLTVNNVVATIQPPAQIQCATPTVTLSSTGSSTGAGVMFQWSGPSIVGPTTNPSCTVNMEGDYTLVVSKTQGGMTCTASATATVVSNANPPSPPSPINGISTVCPGQTLNYLANSSPNATSYNWFLPSGATLQGNQHAAQATVLFGNSGGQLCVEAVNACGPSDTICIPIVIGTAPVAPSILGNSTICGGQNEVYSISGQPASTIFNWTVPTGATIVAGNATASISVNWGSLTGGQVCATVQNSCGISPAGCLTVAVGQTPSAPSISGNQTACAGASENFSVQNVAGQTFNWTVSSSGQITAGQGTSQISVLWNGSATSGSVCCAAQNSCGTSGQTCFNTLLTTAPPSPDLLGNINPCANQTLNYSIDSIAGATSFLWTVPHGASILNGNGTTQISVNWGQSAGGNLCVASMNNCATSLPDCLAVSPNAMPTPNAGPDNQICGKTVDLIGTQSVAGSTANWSLASGPSAAAFSNPTNFSTQVVVNQFGSYVFRLTESNGNCVGTDSTIVVFRPSPTAGAITTTCDGLNQNYTVSFPISGGQPPFSVSGAAVAGSVFTSNLIASGQPFSFQITDALGCQSQAISGSFNCNCLTKAGSMSQILLETCAGQTVQAVAPLNAILDLNDVASFVLHDNPGTSLGQIFAQNTTGIFGIQPNMTFGQTYFISYFVGNNLLGLPDPTDGCRSVAQGTPVIFYENPLANAGLDLDTCGLVSKMNALPSVGFGSWSVGSSPLGATVVFSDPQNPASLVTVSKSGVYALIWKENNHGCLDQSPVVTTFNSVPSALNVLPMCDGTGQSFSVSLTVLGLPPIQVNGQTIVGTNYQSANFPSGSTYDFEIKDATGCLSLPISGKKNCQCLSSAGQMSAQPLSVCAGQMAQATQPTGVLSDANDATAFVLQTIGGASLGQVLAVNHTGAFSFLPGQMTFGQPYFISFVVGNDSLGFPNFNDDCLAIAAGQPVVFYEKPNADAGPDQSICGQTVDLQAVTTTETGVWKKISGAGNLVFSNKNAPTSQATASVFGKYELEWSLVGDGGCTDFDTVEITFHEPPTAGQIQKTCDATATNFQISFPILGGTPPFTTSGTTAQVVGNQVVSDFLASGSNFSIVVTDALGCSSQPIVGMHDCLCQTTAGQMSNAVLNVCESDTAKAILVGNPILDSNDSLIFVLHDGSANALGTIFSTAVQPHFAYQNTLVFGKTYFISAVAASVLASGAVNFNDPCLSVAAGQPVRFFQNPTATFSGDAQICNGQSTALNFSCTGTAPFVVEWSDGGQNFMQTISGNNFSKNVMPAVSTTYHLISIKDGSPAGCKILENEVVQIEVGQPTSATVLPKAEVCNNSLYGSVLNFSTLISSGDLTGSWTDLDNSGAMGSLPTLDFSGLAAGKFHFKYTTAAAQPPCQNLSYVVELTVNDCQCPSVATTAPAPICNSSGSLNLATITQTSAPGSWAITISPSGTSTAEIVSNVFEAAGKDAGLYQLTFTLYAIPPIGCPFSSTQNLLVAPAFLPGFEGYCEGDENVTALHFSLIGPPIAGVWTETSTVKSTGGAFNATTGEFTTTSQKPGEYTFKFMAPSLPPCSSEDATVTVVIHPKPIADAGPDQSLDCISGKTQVGGGQTSVGVDFFYGWRIDGTDILFSNKPTLNVNGVGEYSLRVYAANGCQAEDTVVVTQAVGPSAALFSTKKIDCFGEKTGSISIENITGDNPPYLFSLNGGPFSSQTEWKNLAAGFYEIKVQDAKGCERTDTVEVMQNEKLTLDLGPDFTIELGDSATISATISPTEAAIDTLIWSPLLNAAAAGQTEQSFQTFDSQIVSATVIDSNGCKATDFLRILVDKTRHIYAPNAFSPDSDLNNHFLLFGGQDVVKISTLRVFDRWGELVFENHNLAANDETAGWDGNWQGKALEPAVFVWWAEVEFLDGKTKIYKGDVLLVR